MSHEKARSSAITLLLLILSVSALAAPWRDANEVLVPKDTVFSLELLSPISTQTNQKGDKFECKVLSPVYYAGAIVSGHLRKVKNAGKANGKSELDMAFDSITLLDGRSGGFNAQVKEVNDVTNAGHEGVADPEGTVKGKSKVKISVKRAVAGAATGALIGAIIAGPKGAVVGAAIGTGIAVTSTLATEGPNMEFKAGTQFTVILDAPAHIKSRSAK